MPGWLDVNALASDVAADEALVPVGGVVQGAVRRDDDGERTVDVLVLLDGRIDLAHARAAVDGDPVGRTCRCGRNELRSRDQAEASDGQNRKGTDDLLALHRFYPL
jgi:hypothetical protein